ncbi:hypothetical protein LC612_32330 [Nostoc sp. CHAB 5834]|nr:hypothetical protein [Nostoc sp. CHAB 5834]
MDKALLGLSEIGDFFTDAPECQASVAAAQNLVSLAASLAQAHFISSKEIGSGTLLANGKMVATAGLTIDGCVHPDEPLSTLTMSGPWTFKALTRDEFAVTLFEGESVEDNRWVITDTVNFYKKLLRD